MNVEPLPTSLVIASKFVPKKPVLNVGGRRIVAMMVSTLMS